LVDGWRLIVEGAALFQTAGVEEAVIATNEEFSGMSLRAGKRTREDSSFGGKIHYWLGLAEKQAPFTGGR